MKKLNLEPFVDSSSFFYLADAVGLMCFQIGLICHENFRGMAFLPAKAGIPIIENHPYYGEVYPLYSGDSKEVRN